MDLLEAFFSTDVWDEVLLKSTDKTIPNSLIRYYCTADARLKLLDKIIAGEYHVKPPRVVKIPKDNGDFREIYVNTPRDRIVLAGINQAYYKLFGSRLSTACKAYLTGMSCAKTVREVAKQPIQGYKLDLSKFFDSVSHEQINKCLLELDTGSPLDVVVREYYSDGRVCIDGQIVPRFKSLAQGCAIAAFLSNYVLRDIDNRMLELCQYYCRYSDDMLLLGPNADSALVELKSRLAEIGLSLNPAKIERIDSAHEFKFLGFGIRGSHITISQKDFVAKKQEVKKACKRVARRHDLTDNQRLTKAVKAVKRIFFCGEDPFHSWLYGKAIALNDYSRLAELDKFCKEHIRGAATGCWNYTTNVNRVPEERLREAGYVSLVYMAKAASCRDLFGSEYLLRVIQHMPVSNTQSADVDVPEKVQDYPNSLRTDCFI